MSEENNQELENIIKEYSTFNIKEETFLKLVEEAYQIYQEEINLNSKVKLKNIFQRLVDREIIKTIRCGDYNLKKQYILKNIPLIISIKNKTDRFTSIQNEEAISAGYIALDSAINDYDETKKCTFATYATFKIKRALDKENNVQSDSIGLTEGTNRAIKLINKTVDDLFIKLGHNPTAQEITDKTGMKLNTINQYIAFNNNFSLQDTRVEDKSPLSEIITTPDSENIEQNIEYQELKSILLDYLAKLPAKEREIIKLRYGFHDGKPRTLEEVGQLYGVTRERIRQIEKQGLEKLSTKQKKKRIKSFLIY